MSDDPKPFDASFRSSERYRQPQGDNRTWVVVEGAVCVGEVLGRNGPRAQVRFELKGSTYVRWFDAAALLEEPGR
ncbi:MAG: hypothetical protein JWO27_1234 [Frankiales bacterium]|jgi:hypothetical protein|nr:hypothetical protein [Frankiales bacterium]MCW2706403.1 hypothetical protein [Frankiales bacterium]